MGPSKNNFSGYSIVIFTESLVNNVLNTFFIFRNINPNDTINF